MNKKAEIFDAMLAKDEITAFQPESFDDEFHTVIYRSNIEVKGQYLPVAVILDDSIYSMLRVWVATKVVTKENKSALEAYLNGLNQHYKVFKYYTAENGDLVLDCCLPSSVEKFDPLVIRAVIDVVLQHLQEKYSEIMKNVWTEA